MVCQRCITAVTSLIQDHHYNIESITLGEINLKQDITEKEKNALAIDLQKIGFELIDDKNSRLIIQIKKLIIDQIHHLINQPKTNWSDFIGESLNHDYKYLSRLFSSIEGLTIEQYIIRQKIEKAKELIFYDELNLSEIANRLDYSSVAHLSGQFKKITGMTPSIFKKNGVRKPIDKV